MCKERVGREAVRDERNKLSLSVDCGGYGLGEGLGAGGSFRVCSRPKGSTVTSAGGVPQCCLLTGPEVVRYVFVSGPFRELPASAVLLWYRLSANMR